MHALLHSVPPTLQQTTADPCLCWRFLDTHRQVWVNLLWGHCSFLLGPRVCKVLFVPSKSVLHGRATRTYTGLGKQTLGGHKQNFVHTRTQEKGAVTSQETNPYFPVSVQESLVETWLHGGLLQGWGH